MRYRSLWIAGALYTLAGLVTFGHSAAHNERWFAAHCDTTAKAAITYGCGTAGGTTVVSATTALVLWPLYWSWEAWS